MGRGCIPGSKGGEGGQRRRRGEEEVGRQGPGVNPVSSGWIKREVKRRECQAKEREPFSKPGQGPEGLNERQRVVLERSGQGREMEGV